MIIYCNEVLMTFQSFHTFSSILYWLVEFYVGSVSFMYNEVIIMNEGYQSRWRSVNFYQ